MKPYSLRIRKLDISFGQRLRVIREMHGLRQKDLADMLELSRVTVSNIERGTRSLRANEILTLSRVLGVDPDSFFEAEAAS